ncbi:MAG: DUF1937 family protein [Hyphomicrobiaceae bacterium]|nr:MAG: DUF1937 family protein [Hyphomicrobiaceae bacterium]
MYIYLGTPYTDPSPYQMKLRYEAARALCADIAQSKVPVYSPIVHWHNVAEFYNRRSFGCWRPNQDNLHMPVDVDFWWKQNEPFLKKCHEAWFVKLEGYERSKGIQREIEYCHLKHIPVLTFEIPELYVYLSSYRPTPRAGEVRVPDSGGGAGK